MRKAAPQRAPDTEIACLRAEIVELKAALKGALTSLPPDERAEADRLLSRHSGPIPSAYFNLVDLLQNIANPDRDPNMDVAGVTLMDYWRRDAERLLPSVKSGEITADEETWNLLQAAAVTAQHLRSMRTEYRSPSANFPTMVPVQWAQDGAKMIDGLVSAFKARFSNAQ